MQLACGDLPGRVQHGIARCALGNLHRGSGLQLQGPGAGLVLARLELGLQLVQAGLPVQGRSAFAAGKARLQGGIQLHGFVGLLGQGCQAQLRVFGAAVQLELQLAQA